MKAHVGAALYLHVFVLIMTLDGEDEWSILRSDRFVPGEVALSIYRMEGWVVPVVLGDFVADRNFSPSSGIKGRFVGLPSRSLVTVPVMISKLLQ